MKKHYQIIVVGGGNAGISVSAQILRKDPKTDLAIIDPSKTHYYQPAWTLVGAGDFDLQKTIRTEKEVIPPGAQWIQDGVSSFNPEANSLKTMDGLELTYDQLIVCPGIQLDWSKVKGLKDTLGKNGVTSNYSPKYAEYTWECIKNVPPNGIALFTNPNTPVKCGGAPQKIMYLAGDYFRKKGWTKSVSNEFYSGGRVIFGIKKYADSLMRMVNKYNIKLHFKHNLIEIDGENKIATFEATDAEGNKTIVKREFDMIHVTPPQSAPDFIKESSLANEKGWVDIDKHTMQHNKYENIWSLGDVGSSPNAKTGAAIRKQAPVVTENVLNALKHRKPTSNYNGYGSCPLIVGYGKLVLAEFDYDGNPLETFPFDQAKPRWSMYFLKKRILPWLYWNKILKGTA